MGICETPDCTEKVLARQLCARHYHEQRRRAASIPPGRGRRSSYPPELREKYQGAPHLNVRLEPELFEWVQAQGGVAFVRQVMGELKSTGQVTSGFHPARFLQSLHDAYEVSTGQTDGTVARLRDLYAVLSIRSISSVVYPIEAFTQDVYRLDHHPQVRTAEGLHYRLHPGATAARNRRNLLLVKTPDGLERSYYGIEFVRRRETGQPMPDPSP